LVLLAAIAIRNGDLHRALELLDELGELHAGSRANPHAHRRILYPRDES